MALDLARTARGVTLVHQGGPEREAGFDLLTKIRERALNQRFILIALPVVDIHTAEEKARSGDLDGSIVRLRAVLDELFASGGCIWTALATTVLVQALVQRRGDADLGDAQASIDRLAAVQTDPGFVLNELVLLRLRALLARAHGDEAGYRDYRDRYRTMATSLGFEGHISWAEAMP
jgi:adenylate cyclase